MQSYTHQGRKFFYVRARKSGVVTRAYLDNPLQAEADAEAIDEEFERNGAPEQPWFPVESYCAESMVDATVPDYCSIFEIPLLSALSDEPVGAAYVAIDAEGSMSDAYDSIEDAAGFVRPTGYGR